VLVSHRLGAQVPTRGLDVPMIPAAVRDTATEARLAPPSGPQPRYLRAYTNDVTVEVLFRWYAQHLDAAPREDLTGAASDSVDTVPKLDPGRVTQIKDRIVFHTFEDECLDPPAAPGASRDSVPCRKWRRAKDKRNSLDLVRMGYTRGRWIDSASFTWYVEESGQVVRLRVSMYDTGLSQNWKFYTPKSRMVIAAEVVTPSSP
jgi:hypothetical protein